MTLQVVAFDLDDTLTVDEPFARFDVCMISGGRFDPYGSQHQAGPTRVSEVQLVTGGSHGPDPGRGGTEGSRSAKPRGDARI
jgi:hypothetical protein